ncbi:transglycosylase family protein [Mycobacterium sp. HUMS_1102779]|uniref:transglycosylase family protein n=1 Tax=Mycobacterium sp. HUMS_1102779 TaxID=3383487 RepID=UPI00389A4DFF
MTIRPAGIRVIVCAFLAQTLMVGALFVTALAVSTSYSKAEDVNWEAIAQCESGGDWAADTGNGLFGGLQISQPTWDAHGGYGVPSAAAPDAQVEVADRIMSTQGPGAWPRCATCSPDAAPVGSLSHILGYVEAQGGGCPGVEED